MATHVSVTLVKIWVKDVYVTGDCIL